MTAAFSEHENIPRVHAALSSLLPAYFFETMTMPCFVIVLFLSTAIVTAYETNTQHDPNNNNAMLGVHASASAIIQYGKIARKQVMVHFTLVAQV